MAKWGEINCPKCEELEAKLRKSALQEMSALGQASEAYQAQLAAEAKLERAVEMLRILGVADAILAELKGQIANRFEEPKAENKYRLEFIVEQADRIEELEADLRTTKISEAFWRDGWHALDQDKRGVEAKLAKAVEQEMVRVCNAYAKDGNMIAATAIHDAWLCVQDTIAELNYDERSEKKGQGDE